MAVLCMLYKIRSNPMHPLCGTLPVPYVPVQITRGTLIAHWYTYAPPRCCTAEPHSTAGLLFPSQYLSGSSLFGKSTHISMISNSVTNLRSYTNSAIADIAGNSTPMSPETLCECRYRRAKHRCLRIER